MPFSERMEEAVCVLTLDEPKRRNPLGQKLRKALISRLSELERDPRVSAIVLTGAGGNFSGGGDIADMDETSFAAARERFAVTKDLVMRIAKSSKPVVAAVEGWAAGAGFSLALVCDTIVAAEDARFVASFPRIGLIADFGMLATLPARVGAGRARQILLYAEPLDATKAESWGIVDHLVAPGAALEKALERARAAAALAPMPRAFLKDYLAQGLDEALEFERSVQPLLLRSADAEEGRRAFFEKRPPKFKGA